jgi:putative lipoprotein
MTPPPFPRVLPLLLALAALPSAAAERVAFRCDNGARLDISFSADADGRPRATLHFADGDIVLPGVPAASGALYRADPVRLHTKGDDAVFEDAQGNRRHCSRADAPPPAATQPAAAGSFIDLTGSVAWPQDKPLPAGAVLIVRIQDTARAGAPALTLAEQRLDPAGQSLPIPFAMSIDRDLAGKRARITASARVERAGKLLFISDTVNPAVVDGQPRHVDMMLKPVGGARKR